MTPPALHTGDAPRHFCAAADRSALQRQLPLACPRCRRPIQLHLGLNGSRLIDAILLQAERLGAEIECRDCGLSFILHRSVRHPDQFPAAGSQGLAAP